MYYAVYISYFEKGLGNNFVSFTNSTFFGLGYFLETEGFTLNALNDQNLFTEIKSAQVLFLDKNLPNFL